MSAPKRVGLILDSDNGYFRGIMRGVTRFAKPARNWLIRTALPDMAYIQTMAEWEPDALLAQVKDQDHVKVYASMKIPLIDMGGSFAGHSWPRVRVDDVKVGRMAGEYYIERGFRTLAFVGLTDGVYAQQRESGFRSAVTQIANSYHSLFEASALSPGRTQGTWRSKDEKIQKWLKGLPKPSGVFVASDTQCCHVADLCQRAGIRVPEDIALLGVDNDELFCELAHPRLSSVRVPSIEVGYQAATLLDRMMEGYKAPDTPQLLPPINIVTRQSSDILAIDDPDLARAIRFIRDNVARSIHVDDILRDVPISRRSLEQKFRRVLRRTPLEEISRVRLEHAKELLSMTDLPMPAIARQCGYSNAERMSVVFRLRTGGTPTEYRQRYRILRG